MYIVYHTQSLMHIENTFNYYVLHLHCEMIFVIKIITPERYVCYCIVAYVQFNVSLILIFSLNHPQNNYACMELKRLRTHPPSYNVLFMWLYIQMQILYHQCKHYLFFAVVGTGILKYRYDITVCTCLQHKS